MPAVVISTNSALERMSSIDAQPQYPIDARKPPAIWCTMPTMLPL